MIADLKNMVCFRKHRLGNKGKRVAAKHRHVVSFLTMVASDAEGGRAAVHAEEAKDAVYSESLASISGKASPGSESEADDHRPAHAKRYNPVIAQVNAKFSESAIREPFLDDVYGDIKNTKMTPVVIRACVLPALNSLLDMPAAYQAGLMRREPPNKGFYLEPKVGGAVRIFGFYSNKEKKIKTEKKKFFSRKTKLPDPRVTSHHVKMPGGNRRRRVSNGMAREKYRPERLPKEKK